MVLRGISLVALGLDHSQLSFLAKKKPYINLYSNYSAKGEIDPFLPPFCF